MTTAGAEHVKMGWFTARGVPVLSAGNLTANCGTTDGLRQRIKICAVGEGNPVHAHTKEDHSYFVLQGSAVFFDEHGQEVPVRSFEGIMLPKGAFYGFTNIGFDNLIMLLTFGSEADDSPDQGTSIPKIAVPPGAADFVGSTPGVVVPGRVFDPPGELT